MSRLIKYNSQRVENAASIEDLFYIIYPKTLVKSLGYMDWKLRDLLFMVNDGRSHEDILEQILPKNYTKGNYSFPLLVLRKEISDKLQSYL